MGQEVGGEEEIGGEEDWEGQVEGGEEDPPLESGQTWL